MGKHPLVIRVDADARMGTGHLMRCLALGQAWKDSGRPVVFLTGCTNERLLQRLSDEGFAVHRLERPYPDAQDWQVNERLLAEQPDAWLVLDGYHFDSDYQRRLKEAGYRFMVIDDLAHLPHYYADIVLNQNVTAEGLKYSCEPYAKLLLGTKYVLLRREFWKWRGWKREVPEVARKLLITLGGSDPNNVTLKIIRALEQLNVKELELVVVVGAGNSHYDELQAVARDSPLPLRLERNVTSMPELMAWADVAISSAGSTSWELAFMGLPSLVLVIAANQRPTAANLHERGAALNLGWYKNCSPPTIAGALTRLVTAPVARGEMAQRSLNLVDGEGTARVLMHVKGETLRLRRVREDDCRRLWEWANDPEVRAAAFSSDPIPWEKHVQWFARKMRDPNCFLFAALDDQDTPVGQVRFDLDGKNEAEIDVSVDRSKRGLGYGSVMIRMAVEEMFPVPLVRGVHAFIKPDNRGSIKTFERAKFKPLGVETVRGNTARHYVWVKSNEQ